MRIGVFGGTFDPIHTGHLMVCEWVRETLRLDEVLFVPAGQPYFKSDRMVSEARHRMAMVELAVKPNPFFRDSDMELIRPGTTYTVDTLLELRGEMGWETQIYLMVGLDSLREFDRWQQPKRILDLSKVVGISRPGALDLDAQAIDAISKGASARVKLLDGPLIDVSGSEIRRRVSEGLSIRYQVPEAVEAYIYEHGLYSGDRELKGGHAE